MWERFKVYFVLEYILLSLLYWLMSEDYFLHVVLAEQGGIFQRNRMKQNNYLVRNVQES